MRRRVENPPNPWHSRHCEWLEPPPEAALEVHEERARSILSENDSPDVGFKWSVNPYRGCAHACAYCYARPSHQYLDWGAGTDFDRKILVKVNAPELLRQAFARRSWRGERVAFSGNTDCYQPLEACYRLTRRCLEVCAESGNPASVVTKSALVRRDLDVLAAVARRGGLHAYLTIPFLDPAAAGAMEPGAPPPARRFETIRALAEAGLPVGVGVAPVIPGVNDHEAAEILARAREAGATSAFHVLLRLPAEVADVFLPRLREAFPLRADKVVAELREMRGGRLNDPRFGSRMEGAGPRWKAIDDLFTATCRRLGLDCGEGRYRAGAKCGAASTAPAPPANSGGRLDLFGGETC